jgi:hypothetical protein
MNRDLLLQKIAQGWCTDRNGHKEMDATLAEDIADAILDSEVQCLQLELEIWKRRYAEITEVALSATRRLRAENTKLREDNDHIFKALKSAMRGGDKAWAEAERFIAAQEKE